MRLRSCIVSTFASKRKWQVGAPYFHFFLFFEEFYHEKWNAIRFKIYNAEPVVPIIEIPRRVPGTYFGNRYFKRRACLVAITRSSVVSNVILKLERKYKLTCIQYIKRKIKLKQDGFVPWQRQNHRRDVFTLNVRCRLYSKS